MIARCLIFVVLLVGAATVAAAEQAAADRFEGRPIVALQVTGLRNIKEPVVVDQIASKPGTRYERAIADRDVIRLERLRVFSDVSVTPAEVDGGVRVTVTVVETLRILPAASLAVTDQNGVSIGPTVRLLSIGGKPHEMSATARFGGEKLFKFSEVSPLLTGRRLWHTVDLSFGDRYNDLDDFNEQSLDLDARIGLRGSETWKTGAIFQVYRVRSDQSGITLSTSDADTFIGFGGVVERDTRDSWITPTRGWWNSIDGIWQTGSGNYGTLDFDIRRYQPIAPRHTVVATSLLTLQSGERAVDLPTYADYALGGENTVRGWDFASRRGQNQFINSLEYRLTLLPTRAFRVAGLNLYAGVALAAFADAGTAWSARDDFTRNAIAGGGIGIRLFFPFVDVVRLDFAFGDGVRTQFGINEKAEAQRNRVR